MNNTSCVTVNIADISDDDFFKVSKRNYPAALAGSVNLSGMLEIPYLFKTGDVYNAFTCHNRIKILRESGTTSLKCYLLEEPDAEIFINHAALKSYRNELGPIGKLKILIILNTFFKTDQSVIKHLCTKVLKMPLELLEIDLYPDKVINFPDILLNYLDEKDISFKTIKDLSLLPSDWTDLMDSWIKNIQIRVNIFRMITDNLFDIYRRGDDISVIKSIKYSDDKTLHDSIFRIRYPQYSGLKMRADNIIEQLTGAGLTIDFPEYFERGFATIKLDINKKSDCSEQLKKITEINTGKLSELLSFL